MDFPHHHRHHHRRNDEDEYPPPGRHQPPPYYESDPPPPPPQVTHVYHSSHSGPPPPVDDYGYAPPPPPVGNYGYDPPPPSVGDYGYAPPPPSVGDYGYAPRPPPPVVDSYSSVEHVSHHSFSPNPPSFVHHHSHRNSEINNRPSVRMFTKAEPNYSLTIRDGKVILAPSNPSDPFQHWVKDEKFSTRVKDEEGFPSFALVNKATGQAMKHSIGATHPVQLIPYDPDVLDESVLWTESRDLGDTFRAIRMVNNIRLNVDAFNGDKNHGGVRDGTTIVLWEWKKGDNQRWKIVSY
ncbi:hypothetical protein M9H77_36527 [Catharanthus roseus]|uniref:Uncharacterized protein n=1 Tax=Catharanthus roseus TaxID=4058 RepID=A0ACB9ZWB4_CATRO|nr:hypothetical protein M9H77_36527 [Catharanthus roseus]